MPTEAKSGGSVASTICSEQPAIETTTRIGVSVRNCVVHAYGASRMFDHKIRRRMAFALLTFRRAYLIFRTFIIRGQMLFLIFCNNHLQDLNF